MHLNDQFANESFAGQSEQPLLQVDFRPVVGKLVNQLAERRFAINLLEQVAQFSRQIFCFTSGFA